VLDWELAHLGDSHEDLAYGCMTVWRFGRLDRPAFGRRAGALFRRLPRRRWGKRRSRALPLLAGLSHRVVGARLHGDGATWRARTDRSLERVVISRRTSEQELDLLLLLEEGAPEAERARALPPPPAAGSAGEASAAEILTAISEWLGEAVKPRLDGRDRFDLAVARNALGIVQRELAAPRSGGSRAGRRCAGRAPRSPRRGCSRACAAPRSTGSPPTCRISGAGPARAQWEQC
jgi:hypothetical protein